MNEETIPKVAEGITASQPLPAKTTEQEDIARHGQRVINLLWEKTQSKIALLCIGGTMLINVIVVGAMLFTKFEISSVKIAVISASLASMGLTVGIIIGFYFGRTNHTLTGGIKDNTSLQDRK